jgi:hypothetical protein
MSHFVEPPCKGRLIKLTIRVAGRLNKLSKRGINSTFTRLTKNVLLLAMVLLFAIRFRDGAKSADLITVAITPIDCDR